MTETCTRKHARRFTTPAAMLLGAVLISAGSATAAATITGAQIQDRSITGADIASQTLTFQQIKDGSVGSGDIADGSLQPRDLSAAARNRVVTIRTEGQQTATVPPVGSYVFTAPASELVVTAGQRVVVDGYARYRTVNAAVVNYGLCASSAATGAQIVLIGNQLLSGNIGANQASTLDVTTTWTVPATARVFVAPCAQLVQGGALSGEPSQYSATVLN